jgi:four helix bundle protein
MGKDKEIYRFDRMAKSTPVSLKGYQITKTFYGEEIYGLTSQLRRAAVSVPIILQKH